MRTQRIQRLTGRIRVYSNMESLARLRVQTSVQSNNHTDAAFAAEGCFSTSFRWFGSLRALYSVLIACVVSMPLDAQIRPASTIQAAAEQIFAYANQSRTEAGAGRLQWDPALAAAALYHCRRMVLEGPIAHRYPGEPDLTERAFQAGAHFGLIEENVAIGPSPAMIHDEWMHSPGHRSNLLSPEVDHIGVAVVASRGVLYAVADYARDVPSLTGPQVEARVAELIRASGIAIMGNPAAARAACVTSSGVPPSQTGSQPGFIMRWQDSDLARLPQGLVDRFASGKYRQAAIGSCPAQGVEGAFTAYRVAVLLY